MQQGHGQQPAFEAGVLPRHQPVGAQRRRGLLDLLALEGVTDRAAQRLRIEPSLDEIVLGAGRHGRQAGICLGPAGQHDDGRIGRRLDDPGHGVQAVHIGQMQIEQYAARGVAALPGTGAPPRASCTRSARNPAHCPRASPRRGGRHRRRPRPAGSRRRPSTPNRGRFRLRTRCRSRGGTVLYRDGVRAHRSADGRAARREFGHCPPPCTDGTARPRPYCKEAYVTEPWRSRRVGALPCHARRARDITRTEQHPVHGRLDRGVRPGRNRYGGRRHEGQAAEERQ